MSALPEPVAPFADTSTLPTPAPAHIRSLSAVPDGVQVLDHGRLRSVVEVLVSVVALVMALPLIVVIGVLVVTTSRGPVFFRHVRVGHGGELFEVIKFRTMYADSEARAAELFAQRDDGSGPLNKLRKDPRVTPVGRWLRRFSVDELPQLWNVLTRTMALVGPRPNTPREVARFAPGDHRRHAVRPGMTGLAQVSGRSDLEWDHAVQLDLAYIERRSIWLDLRILLRTIPAVFGGRGAY